MNVNTDAATYWQDRATRFGHVGRGLPAVCSYGMPRLYNETIHACQSHALAVWLRRCRDLDVLDVGCGVGRWSLTLASQGNRVLGVDISSRMVELAKTRNDERGLNCEFQVGDAVSFDAARRFDLVLGVTVLQHVVDGADLRDAVFNMARHVRQSGTLILLEVAPTHATDRCDSPIFRTRTFASYAQLLSEAGLNVVEVTGVDIMPLRPLLLPATRILPSWMGRALVTAAALLSLPIDLVASRHFPNACWHKVMVARRS